MITYKRKYEHDLDSPIVVYLNNRIAGEIKPVLEGGNRHGWFYLPKGSKDGGDVFYTLEECKRSLETE